MTEIKTNTINLKSIAKDIEYDFTEKSINQLNKIIEKLRADYKKTKNSLPLSIGKYNEECLKAKETINPAKIAEIISSNNSSLELITADIEAVYSTVGLIKKTIAESEKKATAQKAIDEEKTEVEAIKNLLIKNVDLVASLIFKIKKVDKQFNFNKFLKTLKDLTNKQ
jgi:hypothetical protein